MKSIVLVFSICFLLVIESCAFKMSNKENDENSLLDSAKSLEASTNLQFMDPPGRVFHTNLNRNKRSEDCETKVLLAIATGDVNCPIGTFSGKINSSLIVKKLLKYQQ